jgi:hypothetical protein
MAVFLVRIQANEKYFSASSDHAIVGATGVFIRGIQLPVGTSVVLRFSKQQDEITLPGYVCVSCGDLGIAIRFKETTPRVVQDLTALVARQ